MELASDLPTSMNLAEGAENVFISCLLAMADANNALDCFVLLQAHPIVWSSPAFGGESAFSREQRLEAMPCLTIPKVSARR